MGGFTAKAIKSSSETWGRGFLLVFFPEDDDHNNSTTTAIVDKSNKLFSSASSSPSSSSPSSSKTCTLSTSRSSFRRSNSNNVLLSKAQSTISICALLVFITLLLFTLSTFEPTTKTHAITTTSRRVLTQKPPQSNTNYTPISNSNSNTNPNNHSLLLSASSWFAKMWKQKHKPQKTSDHLLHSHPPFALQKMGTLYRRGTKAMADLVVGHVQEDVTESELRLFLRLLHRSGLTARADVVFIFASSSSSRFGSVIQEENDSFLKLVQNYRELNRTSRVRPGLGFDVTQFVKKVGKKEVEEPLWGKRSSPRSRNSSNFNGGEGESELTQLSQGSVVGFEVAELDPENSLSGFVDHVVPMSLRRWASYPMLLGRVRRSFKHIMLVDVKNSVVLGDPLGRVRHRSPESVLLFPTPLGKHAKKNSDSTQSNSPVNSAVITGGARGIRRLSNAMLTEIVRATMQRKKKNSVTESGILSQLVANQFISKNIDLATSTESIPDPSSLGAATGLSEHAVIQRGNSNHDFNSIIMMQICSLEIDSSVYRDCDSKQ